MRARPFDAPYIVPLRLRFGTNSVADICQNALFGDMADRLVRWWVEKVQIQIYMVRSS